MKQIPGQISLTDYKYKDTPLGYIDGNKVTDYMGSEIPYNRLGEYIGKKILYSMPRQDVVDYKIIIVTSFRENCENVWESKERNSKTTCESTTNEAYCIVGKASRIGYTDDNRKRKKNSWVSELYCSNGRYKGDAAYQSCMYELI